MFATQNMDKPDIQGVKTAELTTSKYRQDAQQKEQKEKTKCKIPSVIQITIRALPVQDKICSEKKELKRKFKPDASCVKDIDYDFSTDIRAKEEMRKRDGPQCEKRRLLFPEMRGGILYSRCCCLHRDGLQDDCPLTQCQGQPECLVKPWAVCPPGKFVKLRHPELYPELCPKASEHTNCIV